jgi:hypothetical protein
MGLRINIPLPGPFSYSVPMPSVSKSMGKAARAGAKALRDDRARMAAVKREVPARRPAPRPVQRGGTDLDLGVAILWGLVATILLTLLIAFLA